MDLSHFTEDIEAYTGTLRYSSWNFIRDDICKAVLSAKVEEIPAVIAAILCHLQGRIIPDEVALKIGHDSPAWNNLDAISEVIASAE